MGLVFAFLSAVSYAGMAVLVRKATQRGGGDPGILVALFLNVVLHGTVVLARSVSGVSVDWRAAALGLFVLSGVLTTLLGRAALYGGIRRLGPSRAAPLKNLAPFVSVAGAVAFLGERVSALAAAGVVVALAGYLLLMMGSYRRASLVDALVAPVSDVAGPLPTAPSRWQRSRTTWLTTGTLMSVAAAVFYGSGTVVRRVGLDVLPDPYLAALVSALGGGVAYLVYLAIRGDVGSTIAIARQEMNPYFVYAGVLSTVGQLANFLALFTAPVSHVAVVAASDTLLTLVLARLVLRSTERLDRWVWSSGLAVAGGAVLIALA